MADSFNRFFATLRFAQNDNYLSVNGEGVGSGSAASNPLTSPNAITCCHSERSEESIIFTREVIRNKYQTKNLTKMETCKGP